MSEAPSYPYASAIYYRDPRAALVWLERAFGFETTMVVDAADGGVIHSEMRAGRGLLMLGAERDDNHRSPASNRGVNTQSIHLYLDADLDAHCARARAAGAVITREPADQFYGERVYVATDLEGHIWSFGQSLKGLSHAQLSEAGGHLVRAGL